MRTKLPLLLVAVCLLSGCAALTLTGEPPESTEPKSPDNLTTTSDINRERSQSKTTESRYDRP